MTRCLGGDGAAVEPVASLAGAVDTVAAGQLAGLVERLEAALARFEALGSIPAPSEPASAAVGHPVKLSGPLVIHPLPQFEAVGELEELGPVLDLDELDSLPEYDGEGLGWEDDELARYRAASLAVADAVRLQLRLHGQLDADTLAAGLAEQFDLPGSDAELLSREVRSRVETDWQTVLECTDEDQHGLPAAWRVIEPAEVCEACGIESLRDISGDAPAAWREMVGHWLYRQAVKHRGVSQADRVYGAFALINYAKRLEWNRRGERGARISAGLKARALVKGKGVQA